jgi:hypothetical protein
MFSVFSFCGIEKGYTDKVSSLLYLSRCTNRKAQNREYFLDSFAPCPATATFVPNKKKP